MASLSGTALWKYFRLKGTDSSTRRGPGMAIGCFSNHLPNESLTFGSAIWRKGFCADKHDWSVGVTIKPRASSRDTDHNILSLYYISTSMIISFLSGNGATICYNYLQFKYMSLFLFQEFDSVFWGFCSWSLPCCHLSAPDKSHQEHIPARAWKPSGCVDGCHLLKLICFLDSLLASLEQVSVRLV